MYYRGNNQGLQLLAVAVIAFIIGLVIGNNFTLEPRQQNTKPQVTQKR